jgi:tetratricopeptide (TPR) repeat protein
VYNAQLKLTELESRLNEDEKIRWKCPCLLLLSRIRQEMGDYTEAEVIASEAFEYADDTKQLPYQIEALIVRGETRIYLGKIEEAREDLQGALTLNKDGAKQTNPKVEAICLLHLARSYALKHDRGEAKRYFASWEQIKQNVEHKIIREIADEIKKEIDGLSKDFVIPADVDNLNYDVHLKALQRFLVNQAKQRTQTLQEATEELKISRQTLHQWQKEKKK